MGYNIADVSGNATGGPNDWGLTLDLSDPSATTISGDFDVVSLTSGNSQGEATGGCADSGLTAAVGAPTLCATGPVGGRVHTPDEYLEVATIVPRAQAAALTALRLLRG